MVVRWLFVDRTGSFPYSKRMIPIRPQLHSILVAAVLIATAWVHPVAVNPNPSHHPVLGNQTPGCGTTTCPKKVEVFGLLVPPPRLDLAGLAWFPPFLAFYSVWILPIPHVGRAPPLVASDRG